MSGRGLAIAHVESFDTVMDDSSDFSQWLDCFIIHNPEFHKLTTKYGAFTS